MLLCAIYIYKPSCDAWKGGEGPVQYAQRSCAAREGPSTGYLNREDSGEMTWSKVKGGNLSPGTPTVQIHTFGPLL